jgi:hypothetical protein
MLLEKDGLDSGQQSSSEDKAALRRALPIYGSKREPPDASTPRERFQECCCQIYGQFYNDGRSDEFEERNEGISFGFELD